jgi:Flp pilus assembly pilin Flp
VCEKEGHMAKNYRYCFNENYEPERRTVAAVTHSYVVDTNWYTDTGATYHITGELEKLDVKNKYACVDQVHTVSGSGMNISHIRHSVIPTLVAILLLKIFSTFLKLIKVYFSFIGSLLTIMPLLNIF